MIRFHGEFPAKLFKAQIQQQQKANKTEVKWNKRGRLLYDTFIEASSLVRKAVFFKSMTQAAMEK